MFPRLELQGHSRPCNTHMTTLWVMVMKLRSTDQAGKDCDSEVCHVWKLLCDCISGYTAADDRSVTMAGWSALRHFQQKWHCLWLSCVFVSEYLCSTVSFHDIMTFLIFSISSLTFGLLHFSTGLCPLIDFPIESETWKQRGTDSPHCFHLCGTMMISPAAACQPPLFCSHQTSSTEKLLLITSPYCNYSSLGMAVSPGTGTEVRRETAKGALLQSNDLG